LRIPPATSHQIRYITLSHRWGIKPEFPLKLTQRSIADLTKCIPLNLLPPTFQDAVTICRQLQIRYLWIDALCIIQDSIDDWLRESEAMGQIYKNAVLNIAAAIGQTLKLEYFSNAVWMTWGRSGLT
jgi:hypothetical protein